MPPTPNDSEWTILDALWERGPSTAPQIAEALSAERGWAYSTVKTMLDRMVKKELVRGRQVGNVWEYTAAIEPDQARRTAWQRFIGAAFGGATAPALRFIANDAKLTKRERDLLRRMLEESTTREGGE